MVDWHKFWRNVADAYEHLAQDAPEGYEPQALAFVARRDGPIEIGQVSTTRDPDYPWVGFTTVSSMRMADPQGDSEKTYADDQIIFVHETTILRVELGFVRKEPGANPRSPIGFTVESDPPDV